MEFGRDCPLRDSLSDALRQAVQEYIAFTGTAVPENVEGLPARHAAGKIMVGHITALAKLVHWWSAAGAAAPADDGSDLPDMMAAARKAVSRYAADED